MNRHLPVITRIVPFITSRISPERVILFGSYARGDNRADSDIDILILIKNLKNERAVTGMLYKALLEEDINTPVDLLAMDYDKYNLLKNDCGYVYRTIEHEGQVLYVK